MPKIVLNELDDCTELWIDGVFEGSWNLIEVPDASKAILESMLDSAIEHGKRLKAAEVRDVIGA